MELNNRIINVLLKSWKRKSKLFLQKLMLLYDSCGAKELTTETWTLFPMKCSKSSAERNTYNLGFLKAIKKYFMDDQLMNSQGLTEKDTNDEEVIKVKFTAKINRFDTKFPKKMSQDNSQPY